MAPPATKRQEVLPFARTIITRSANESIVIDSDSAPPEPPAAPSKATEPSPSLAPSSQGIPQPEPLLRAKQTSRQSWIFRYMLDADIQLSLRRINDLRISSCNS
jgi:hypothetical protein